MKIQQSGAAYKTLLLIFIILGYSNIVVFGQNNNVAPKEKPTPSASDNTKEPSKPQDAPTSSEEQNNYAPNYQIPPSPPEARKQSAKERKRLEAESQKILDNYKKYLEQQNQSSDESVQRFQDLNPIQPETQQNPIDQLQQNKGNEVQTKRQAEEVAKDANKIKWMFGLFFICEILQIVALGIIAFKTNRAKKSVIAMLVGGLAMLFVYLNSIFPSVALGVLNIPIGFLGIYAFVVGKLSACVIFSQTPKTLPLKLLYVFGIGLFLIAIYQFIGLGSYGTAFGLAVIIIGGVIALVKSTKGKTDDLHGSARFAERKDFKELKIR